jgi:hypothetical protein
MASRIFKTMTCLISHVLSLPPDVIGAQVLCFLRVEDMVRFDSALATKIYRLPVEEAFARCTVDLGDTQAMLRRNFWRWCMKRLVIIKKLQFSSLDSEDIPVLEKFLQHCVSVDATVHWHCSSAADEMGFVTSILNNNTIRRKITSLSWSDNAANDFPPATPHVWSELKCLTRLHMSGAERTEQALSQILLTNDMLQCVTLRHFTLLSRTTVDALCSRSASLVSLSLFAVQCHPDLLSAVCRSCCNLRHLSLIALVGAERWVTEAGLVAVATGCRKLQLLAVYNVPAVTEAVLLAVAAYCLVIESLYCVECGTITDEVLLALSTKCLKLRRFASSMWAVRSVSAVDAAQLLLSRLVEFTFHCAPEAAPVAVARAVVLLKKVPQMSITNVTSAHIAAICGSSLKQLEGISLTSKPGEPVAVDELILKLASNSPRLETFSFCGDCTVLESTLQILAALYPGITSAVAQSVPDGVTQATLITLLSSWTQLTALGINHNVSVSDTVLHAVTQYCPHLYGLNLSANTIVSEEAVLELVRKPNFYMLTVPTTFSFDARQRVRNAASAARKADKR